MKSNCCVLYARQQGLCPSFQTNIHSSLCLSACCSDCLSTSFSRLAVLYSNNQNDMPRRDLLMSSSSFLRGDWCPCLCMIPYMTNSFCLFSLLKFMKKFFLFEGDVNGCNNDVADEDDDDDGLGMVITTLLKEPRFFCFLPPMILQKRLLSILSSFELYNNRSTGKGN